MKETYISTFPIKQRISGGMSWVEINELSWSEVNLLDWFRISKIIEYFVELASTFIQKTKYLSTFETIKSMQSEFEKKLL